MAMFSCAPKFKRTCSLYSTWPFMIRLTVSMHHAIILFNVVWCTDSLAYARLFNHKYGCIGGYVKDLTYSRLATIYRSWFEGIQHNIFWLNSGLPEVRNIIRRVWSFQSEQEISEKMTFLFQFHLFKRFTWCSSTFNYHCEHINDVMTFAPYELF